MTEKEALERLAEKHYRHKDGACICGLPFPCSTFVVLLEAGYAKTTVGSNGMA